MINEDYLFNTYNRFPIVLEKGEGAYVYDDRGEKYLDFVGGIAVNSLGHSNEKLTEALASQAKNLIHVSNLYWTKPQLSLAKKLVENSLFQKAFFCNSGAEAVEGALKLARKYACKQKSGRYEIIAMKNSFHGRTYAAVTATGQPKYQEGFSPLMPGITHVPFNDFQALREAITDKTCAVLLEPIQGEGGIHSADAEYLRAVRALCDESGLLLIYDEVQCGVGRTGKLFAYELSGVVPDVLTLAKGLAGGVPIGAILAKQSVAEAFAPGDHASTFGGNPLACAAANVILEELLENGLLAAVKENGDYLRKALLSLAEKHSGMIAAVRGVGLMQGIELHVEVSPVISRCMEAGLLLIGAGPKVIRFVPPLIITKEQINECMEILSCVLKAAAKK